MRSKPSACMCEVTSIKIIDDQLSILESKHLSIDHWCWSTKHWHSDIDIGNQPSRHRPSTEKLYHRGINHQHWSSTIKSSTLTIEASTINIESWPSRYEQLTIDIDSWPSIINDRHRTGSIQKHQFLSTLSLYTLSLQGQKRNIQQDISCCHCHVRHPYDSARHLYTMTGHTAPV